MGSFRVVTQAFAGMTLLAFAGSAQSFITSTTFDFLSMGNASGTYGESAFNTLNLSGTGFTMNITATKEGNAAFAYFDNGDAGLGVCGSASGNINQKNPGSGTNLCNPSSDDNVTFDEVLTFDFDVDVVIDDFWFNNNHDGGFNAGDKIDIGGTAFDVTTGVVGDPNGIGPFTVLASDTLTVGFYNEQFYMSAMTISVEFPDPPNSVPEPGTLVLLAFGLAGIGYGRKKKFTAVSAARS